jgi:hypothetical protein
MKFLQRLTSAWRVLTTGGAHYDMDMEPGWRPLSSDKRDLSPLMHDRMLQVADYLYERNPMSRRLVEMTAEYIVGEGIEIKAKDEAVQKWVADFWNDPINRMDLHFPEYVKELGLWGEQCYRLFVNKFSGRVRLGYIDPMRIAAVVKDEDNLNITRKVEIKGKLGMPGPTYECITFEDETGPGYYNGDTLYFKINSTKAASRGRSDLFTMADFLDLFSQFVFSRGERSLLGNAFMWDVTLEGMTPAEIQEFAKKQKPPEPGAVRYHNEKVKWNAVAPDLKAYDASFDGQLIKNFILGSYGFAEHFFGSGMDINKAVAQEMNETVIKRLAARQRYLQEIFKELLSFVIYQGKVRGRLPMAAPEEVDIYFPEISTKDMQRSGLTMLHLAQSLLLAQQQQWVDQEAAARLYCSVASMFGPNIQPSKGDGKKSSAEGDNDEIPT